MAAKKKAVAKKALKKPKPVYQTAPAYNWSEVCQWIEHKTGKDVRDWAGRHKQKRYNDKIPYQDFWHWLVDMCDIHNGSHFHLDLSDDQVDDGDSEHLFVREILAVLRKEFPEAKGEMYCYVFW